MTRSQHRLDLLPLLDVFMVVLFVFATIQEQQLDAAQRETQKLRDASAPRSESDHANAQARHQELRRQLARTRVQHAQVQAANAALTEQLEAIGQGQPSVLDTAQRNDVLRKLLDQYSVFEIEISGVFDPAGDIRNACCYRADPYSGTWNDCGTVPPLAIERTAWAQAGMGGLQDALRKTKGGNAMAIVRQDRRATYQISRKLETLLRERFAGHKVYDDGVTGLSSTCSSAPLDGSTSRQPHQ